MLLVGWSCDILSTSQKKKNPQVVSILCTWAFDENQKKEGPVGVGNEGEVPFCRHKRVGPRAGKTMSPETASRRPDDLVLR